MAYVKHEAIHCQTHMSNVFGYDAKPEKITVLESLHLDNLFSYAAQDKKTEKQLMSFINCNQDTLENDFMMAKIIHGKTDKIIAHQYFQSFKPGEGSAELIHSIGVELANKIAPSYQVAVYTHVDRDHLHNHIVINSVSLETGYKFVANKASLQHIREVSDELCRKYNLSIIQPDKELKSLDRETYRNAVTGGSWKIELSNVIDSALIVCKNKDEFIGYLKESGFDVKYYQDNISVRKFSEPKAIRLNTFANQFGASYSKKSIDTKLKENAGIAFIPERLKDPMLKLNTHSSESSEAKNSSWKHDLIQTLDQALSSCKGKEEFIRFLTNAGYQVNYQNKNISISKGGCGKAVRVDTFARYYGKRFSKEEIEKRLNANNSWMFDVKESIGKSLVASHSKSEFVTLMEKYGYEIEFRDTGIFVNPNGTKKFLSFDTLSKTFGFQYQSEQVLKKLDPNGFRVQPPSKSAGRKKQEYKTEWDRYTKWYFDAKKPQQTALRPNDGLINSLKNSILYSRDMNLMIIRLIVLSVLMLGRRHSQSRGNINKKYRVTKKNSFQQKPSDGRVFQNINYYNLIHSDGQNLTIKIMPQQVGLLFNQPLFYSAKVYEDGRANVTIKAKDEALLYHVLGIDPRTYERDREIREQKMRYARIKNSAEQNDSKLTYRVVDKPVIEQLNAEKFDFAYFEKGGGYNVCFDERLTSQFNQLAKRATEREDYRQQYR